MAKDGERDDPPRGFSRRDLLRGGAAMGVLGTGLLRGVPPAEPAAAGKAEAGTKIAGPGAVPMSFRINGRQLSAQLEPRVTLLDALRTRFELTGAKRVCDRGTCGACTVLLDGRTVYACSILAIEAQHAEIETVEGLGAVDRLHPLQAAFVENDAQQCGFCTPGFIVSAKALLDKNPNPTLAEIHHGLSGNFCRCGTYAGIRGAVLQVVQAGAANPDYAPGMPGAPGFEKKREEDEPGEPGETAEPRRKHKHGKKHRRGGGHGGL
jgi:xanthine dehydrogenase YagT iron-sulfur-binding subunit